MNEESFKSLIYRLSDGVFHSGESLGHSLGVSRAAIWKRLQSLEKYGILLESVKGRGYRIPGGLSLLDSSKILAGVNIAAQSYLGLLSCFDTIDSTNEFLLRGSSVSGDVCLAERQSSGRGRRGRDWFSPYGKNLYLSLCWHFDQGVSALDGLSLAVGVLLAEALAQQGVVGVQLKWPNDLLINDNKLGGILIEVGGDLTGDCKVVIGIGLNVAMSEVIPVTDREKITQPWTDLRQAGYDGGRNELIGGLLSLLLPALHDYPATGFASYRDRWHALNAHRNQSISLRFPERVELGVMAGVNEKGALILKTPAGKKIFSGGEVSLRSVK